MGSQPGTRAASGEAEAWPPSVKEDPLGPEVVVGLLRDLVRIPSVNSKLASDEAHGEERIASFAVEWLKARGVKARLEEVAPGRPNAVGEVGDGERPGLILC